MVSTKPYLVRAIYEWCVDLGFTPYLAVQVDAGTRVPREYVKDGQIVLNVSSDATAQLRMGNDDITFQARFNGASFPVVIPIAAVAAIYARENGQGMAFDTTVESQPDVSAAVPGESDQPASIAESSDEQGQPPPPAGRPHLTRIK